MMTKDRLQGIVRSNTKHPMCMMTVLDAVEKYTAAQIAQNRCSTLRETLNQMLSKVQKAKDRAGTNQKMKYMVDESSILRVMELMDELQPVA